MRNPIRLDLFLKNTRLWKRRSRAQEAAETGLVLLNGRPTKPGKTVKPGDELTLRLGRVERRVRVLAEAVRPAPKGQEALFYEVLSEVPIPAAPEESGWGEWPRDEE